MRIHFLVLLIFPFFLLGSNALAQSSSPSYDPIQSAGEIPTDFTRPTQEKIEKDLSNTREGLNKAQHKRFVKEIYFGIDQILQSGRVSYGDPISLYVEQVAKKLTQNHPEYSNLRYYLIQSNVVNAFSTDQGIVFITEGMFARLKNEAQLAAILAHELIHFQRKHIQQSFIEKIHTNHQYLDYDTRIQQMNQFSRLKELEADSLGLQLYYETGYPKNEIIYTFDLLNYATLPFDNVPIPNDYWNSATMIVPNRYFIATCPPLAAAPVAKENYDEDTHPSVALRKEVLERIIRQKTNWKDEGTQNNVSEQFIYLRNLARLETIRNDLFAQNYEAALYSIFLLKKSPINPLLLARYEAQAYLGLSMFYTAKSEHQDIVGEQCKLVHFLQSLTHEQLLCISLAKIADLQAISPQDEELRGVLKAMMCVCVRNGLTRANFFQDSYEAALAKCKEDSSKIHDLENRFHLYALNDKIKDSVFTNQFTLIEKQEIEKHEKARLLLLSQADKKKKHHKKPIASLGLTDCISLEPTAVQFLKKEVDMEASSRIQDLLAESVSRSAKKSGVTITPIQTSALNTIGTRGFNEKSLLLKLVYQSARFDTLAWFPVDYSLLREVQQNSPSQHVVFLFLKNTHRPLSLKSIVIGMIVPPIGLTALAMGILRLNTAVLSAAVVNLQNFSLETKESIPFGSRPSPRRVEKKINLLFLHLHQTPNN